MTDGPPRDPGDHTGTKAGDAFLINPRGGVRGPGVLLLHSWWGLTDEFKDLCERVADLGYTVLAPDLLVGQRPTTEEEGRTVLAEIDADELSGLVVSSAHTLRAVALDETAPIAVVGYSMGGSMALWLSARLPGSVRSVITFYGAQAIDFDQATAVYQGHFGDTDTMVSDEDRITTESFIRLGGKHTEFHLYEGVGHWFAEPGPHRNEPAAEEAWDRMVRFLAETHPPAEPADPTDGSDAAAT